MKPFYQIFLSAAATLLTFGLWKAATFLYQQYKSPLRIFPGPKSTHLLLGNFKEILKEDETLVQDKWIAEYGRIFKFWGVFNTIELFITDTKAISHILSHSYQYQRPNRVRKNIARIFGNGVLATEGDEHKRQRKIMNPAFGNIQIRELTGVFTQKANQLRDIWASEIKKVDYKGRIDAFSYMSKVTLDVIGLAGFNYEFNALNPEGTPNELDEAFSTLFREPGNPRPIEFLRAFVPIFRLIPNKRGRDIKSAKRTMDSIGRKLLDESKAAAIASEKNGENSTSQHRDLLTLLVRANTAKDLPDNQRLSDEDVLAQVPTFLIAGHVTTSTSTTWALFALTQAPEIQAKLREELLTISTDSPSMDDLSSLPYLDAFVRETLRMYPPVAFSARVAMEDDVIPLDTPFVDKRGRVHTEVTVRKGDRIVVPILAMNKSKDIWGEDAASFRPERWESVPKGAQSIPGVWGNQLTFLGGPRACIGYKFSLIEMKALIFALVRAFEFELAVPAKDMLSRRNISQRPMVASEIEQGPQMPLRVKPYLA